MPHFVVQRDPARFPFGSLTRVYADAEDCSDPAVLRFVRDGAICFQAPAADVLKVTPFDTQLQADAHIKELRRWRSGCSTVHVQESGGVAAAPAKRLGGRSGGGSAIPAEGITFKINES